MNRPRLALTRIANACVLIELAGHTVLTDPWFAERWYLRRGEPLGLPLDALGPLTAIIATSFAANHWDVRALAAYPHKDRTPVYVSAALDARVLVPVHDAHANDLLSLFFRRHGSAADAAAMAPAGLDVVCLPPGQRWEDGE